jgi:hypothetical protein
LTVRVSPQSGELQCTDARLPLLAAARESIPEM